MGSGGGLRGVEGLRKKRHYLADQNVQSGKYLVSLMADSTCGRGHDMGGKEKTSG